MKLFKSLLGVFAFLGMILLITSKSIYAGIALLVVAAVRLWIMVNEIRRNKKLINKQKEGYWEVPRTEANAWLFEHQWNRSSTETDNVSEDEIEAIDRANENIKESGTVSHEEVWKQQ